MREGGWKNHQNLISEERVFFIYKKRIYILNACVGWDSSQNVIDGVLGEGWNKNVLAGKIFQNYIAGGISIRHQRVPFIF